MSQVKEFKPVKLWVSGESKPLEYKDSIEALKDVKSIQNATSASIEITERVDNELNAIQKGNKKLSFMDVKYVPAETKLHKPTNAFRDYPAKLLFRVATPRDTD